MQKRFFFSETPCTSKPSLGFRDVVAYYAKLLLKKGSLYLLHKPLNIDNFNLMKLFEVS